MKRIHLLLYAIAFSLAACLSTNEPGQYTSCDTYRSTYPFDTDGKFLYTDAGQFSLADPANPSLIVSYHYFGGDTTFIDSSQPGKGYSLSYQFHADSIGALISIGPDVTIPAYPRHLAYTTGLLYVLRHKTGADNNIFCNMRDDTLNALDVDRISDTSMMILSEMLLSDPQDIAINGTTLYVLDAVDGLKIFSLANPQHPALIATVSTAVGYHLQLTQQSTVLVYTANGIAQYDISQPGSPVLRSTIM